MCYVQQFSDQERNHFLSSFITNYCSRSNNWLTEITRHIIFIFIVIRIKSNTVEYVQYNANET